MTHCPQQTASKHGEKERTFAAIIRRGIADWTLREDLDPEAAARCITTGLQVRRKLGLSRDEGNETVAMTIDTFF